MGTLVVNLLGCFLAGLLSYLMFERFLLSQTTRTVLLIGLLGGFTTFSSFGLQSFNMLRDGEVGLALLNVGLIKRRRFVHGLAGILAGKTYLR